MEQSTSTFSKPVVWRTWRRPGILLLSFIVDSEKRDHKSFGLKTLVTSILSYFNWASHRGIYFFLKTSSCWSHPSENAKIQLEGFQVLIIHNNHDACSFLFTCRPLITMLIKALPLLRVCTSSFAVTVSVLSGCSSWP